MFSNSNTQPSRCLPTLTHWPILNDGLLVTVESESVGCSMDKFVKTVEFIQEPNDIVFITDKFNHTVFNEEETMGIVVELL